MTESFQRVGLVVRGRDPPGALRGEVSSRFLSFQLRHGMPRERIGASFAGSCRHFGQFLPGPTGVVHENQATSVAHFTWYPPGASVDSGHHKSYPFQPCRRSTLEDAPVPNDQTPRKLLE